MRLEQWVYHIIGASLILAGIALLMLNPGIKRTAPTFATVTLEKGYAYHYVFIEPYNGLEVQPYIIKVGSGAWVLAMDSDGNIIREPLEKNGD